MRNALSFILMSLGGVAMMVAGTAIDAAPDVAPGVAIAGVASLYLAWALGCEP